MAISLSLFHFGFSSFFCLVPAYGNSSAVLNQSSESGHPCLVPDLRKKPLIFPPFSISAVACYK